MTNNTVKGTKKSAFIGSTTIPSGSYLDFVVNGQNLRILDTDFYAALGVTGTIVQVGDPSGSPVLDQQGTINGIRNITDGFGISSTINAQNGITIATDFSFNETGEALVDDVSSPSPTFKSLLGGDSVDLLSSDNTITINLNSDNIKPDNRVYINAGSDFPAVVSGYIPLAPLTEYYIGANVTITSPFVVSGDTTFNGRTRVSNLNFDGTGAIFTGVDSGGLVIQELSFNAPNADLVDISNTMPTSVVNIRGLTGELNSLGSVTDIVGTVFETCAFTGLNAGFSDIGTSSSVLSMSKVGMISANAAFKAIDMGSNVYNSLEIMNLQVVAPVGAVGISGLASSGNISVGQLGSIQSCEFIGGVAPLENLTSDDIRYKFISNGGIQDTYEDALLSLNSNSVETVIAASGVPVLVAGVWTVGEESQFTGTVAGRATYVGERSLSTPITASLSFAPASGTNKDISAYVAINGTVVTNSGITVRGDNNNPLSITLVWQKILVQNDYVEIFVSNNTDSVNILVSNSVSRLR